MPQSCPSELADELLAAARSAEPFAAHRGKGSGIVVCAGGPVMIANAYVLVRLLREHLGSVLPIEIWHCGAQEMPRFLARQFIQLGCDVVDALSATSAGTGREVMLDGWQLKAHALRYTTFEEVILLDADQVPLRDPAELFDWPQYRETGAIFWPDVVDLPSANPVWQRLGLEPRQVCSWESGQLCINRRRHWLPVCLVHAMNMRADILYGMVYGDKDTFLLAWLMLDADHVVVPHKPYSDDRYLCQRDFAGNGLFQHRTNCKWSLHGDNFAPDGFGFMDICESYLRDLKAVWNGRMFFPPGVTSQSRRLEQAVISGRTFVLSVGSEPSRTVELLDGNQIGKGRSYELMNWHAGAGPEGNGIYLCDANKETAFLIPGNNGLWHGQTLRQPSQPVVLSPVGEIDQVGVSSHSARGVVDDLIAAIWNGGYNDDNSIQIIVATLRGLSMIDPRVPAEIGESAARYRREDPRLSAFLDEVATRLNRVPGDAPRVRNHDLIFDETYYVRT